MNHLSKLFFITGSVFISIAAVCQPNTTIDLEKDKPKQYENRILTSEKTGDKKFGFPRNLLQNTYTHYNYVFNANNRLNEVINHAKQSYKDDYTKLLAFYNYTIDGTASNKSELDSIIYKCTAAILLHDLRNNWIDDAYLLLGKAYFYRKDFDSAYYVFQYINYIYAPKDDGYDIPLGSNASNTNGIFTVATDESKRNVLSKATSKAPSRNETLLWLVRNDLEQNKIAQASGLLSILKSDPNFPQRLKTDLHELIAYNFYKQGLYDSSAYHLQKSLDNADGKSEQARWEYLCGQMYKLTKQDSAAVKMFERSIQHTVDPYMDVYARLNIVSLTPPPTKKGNPLQHHLDELYKLAKRDKFEDYRDIIYYVAALLELRHNDKPNAKKDLLNSIKFSVDNVEQKQKSLLLLADIEYTSKQYLSSHNFYDSIQISAVSKEDLAIVDVRKPALKTIAEGITTVHLQDSLQLLAKMSEEDRNAAVKKIYKQLRKEQGAKENDIDYGSLAVTPAATNLFAVKSNSSDFYFTNANIKSQGFREFKTQWGNRPNVDNWQRQNAVSRNTPTTTNLAMVDIDQVQTDVASTTDTKEISIENLLLNIPLNEAKIDTSNAKIIKALFTNGITFQNQLENYEAAMDAYEELLRRFPNTRFSQPALFNLYYCYTKLKYPQKADSVKQILNKNYSDGDYTDLLNNGNKAGEQATKRYENIYNLFIEGRFEEAKIEKMKADNQYGRTYWTPQMLYIESLYYVRQKQDSLAINKLQTLVSTFPTSPLVDKATTMIDVVRRRREIEAYLTNLQIEQKEDSLTKRVDISAPAIANATTNNLKIDSVKSTLAPALSPIAKPADTKPAAIAKNGFVFNDQEKHFVIVILDKVDDVFTNEARNTFNRFNKEKFYNDKIDINSTKLDDKYTLLLIGSFNTANDAISYVDRTKPYAASRIVSWLPANKYSFSIISNANLDVLKNSKNIDEYKQFIKQFYPDKF